jgi:hypothetical protein
MRLDPPGEGIGRLHESELHEQLKHRYAGKHGETEAPFMGFVVDVLLPNEIVEIQTRGFGKLRKKIESIASHRQMRIVHPISIETTITKLASNGELLSSRRSPKRGRVEDAFREIATIADLLPASSVAVEIALVRAVEIRMDDGRGSWRRKGVSIVARQLGAFEQAVRLQAAEDFLALLPEGLPRRFSNRDLMEAASLRYAQAQPMTNALAKMGLIAAVDRRGRERIYEYPLQARAGMK